MDTIVYSKVFWGVVVLLIGISIIAQAVFKINLPVFKIVFGLILLYAGFKVLAGAFGFKSTPKQESASVFSSQRVSVDQFRDNVEYSSVFGSQEVDFTMAGRIPGDYSIECNSVCRCDAS